MSKGKVTLTYDDHLFGIVEFVFTEDDHLPATIEVMFTEDDQLNVKR